MAVQSKLHFVISQQKEKERRIDSTLSLMEEKEDGARKRRKHAHNVIGGTPAAAIQIR
jgi:hypothetical protein